MKTPIVITCLLTIAAFGQTIEVTDNSPSDSPLRWKGTVSLGNDADATCSITGYNSDSRTIIAWAVQMGGTKLNGLSYDQPVSYHDHFFKSDATIAMMSPKSGVEFNSDMGCASFSHNHGAAATATPTLTVATTMVQFNDGTVWGDPAAAKELVFQRQDTISYLQSLQLASNLATAVAQRPNGVVGSGPKAHLRWGMLITSGYLQDDQTTAAVAADIKNRLALAKTHNAWLTAMQ